MSLHLHPMPDDKNLALAPLLKPYWKRELEVLAYTIFALAYSVAPPLASKYLVDTVLPDRNLRGLVLAILVLLALYVVDALVGADCSVTILPVTPTPDALFSAPLIVRPAPNPTVPPPAIVSVGGAACHRLYAALSIGRNCAVARWSPAALGCESPVG